MTEASTTEAGEEAREIFSTRIINWPRALVFGAFADPVRLARWWGPKGFTNTFETFDFTPGGAWRFVMHGPNGANYDNLSAFVEIVPMERIVFDHVSKPHFRMTITLDDLAGATRIGWRMRFESTDARERIAGIVIPANEENFDRLEAELARSVHASAAEAGLTRSVTHATFVVRRDYDATPERVFAAFADPKLKARWFSGPPEWEPNQGEMDFRVGGFETSRGGPKGGPFHQFRALYQDIIPNERIVYSYDMHLGDVRISVSLATIELKRQGAGTRLVFTEQGAFLDGFDDAGGREHGTRALLEQLGASLVAGEPH